MSPPSRSDGALGHGVDLLVERAYLTCRFQALPDVNDCGYLGTCNGTLEEDAIKTVNELFTGCTAVLEYFRVRFNSVVYTAVRLQ